MRKLHFVQDISAVFSLKAFQSYFQGLTIPKICVVCQKYENNHVFVGSHFLQNVNQTV